MTPFDLDAPGPALFRPLRGMGAALFGAAVRARKGLYDLGIKSRARADCPVVSVGNLTVGGSGKTPLVIALVRALERSGVRVAVLSRGYGGRISKSSSPPVLVAAGGKGLVGSDDAGDEPVLIGKKTHASVVVSPDRVAGARFAVQEAQAELVILDDGFQHLRLIRDLDVVVVDAKSPFGNGRLIPAGSLREPKEALSRADVLVINHGDSSPEEGAATVDIDSGLPRVSMRMKAVSVGPCSGGERTSPEMLRGKQVALLAAIARPERVKTSLVRLGATIVHEDYRRDHATFSAEELRAFLAEAEQKGAEMMMTTEKDAVRMQDRQASERFWTLAVEAVLEDGGVDLLGRVLALIGRAGETRE